MPLGSCEYTRVPRGDQHPATRNKGSPVPVLWEARSIVTRIARRGPEKRAPRYGRCRRRPTPLFEWTFESGAEFRRNATQELVAVPTAAMPTSPGNATGNERPGMGMAIGCAGLIEGVSVPEVQSTLDIKDFLADISAGIAELSSQLRISKLRACVCSLSVSKLLNAP